MSRILVYLILSLTLAGCGRSGLAPVSGRVLLDGQPLADVVVTFQPLRADSMQLEAPGVGSFGKTDAEGRFTLRCIAGDAPGAFPGSHKVYVGATGQATDDVTPVATRKLPDSCTDGSLTFEVPAEGTTAANFDLKSR